MTAQDKPLVFDVVNGTVCKAVWVERGRFYCRAGTGQVECEMQQPGIFKTLPGTFESAPKPKVMPEWKRRALARMAT